MSDTQKILIFDFGGQYTQLIARRVRECHVYSEVVPWSVPLEEIRKQQPAGIILSGGPSTVHDENAPMIDPGLYTLGIPVLGICYGMQLTAHLLGGRVEKAKEREYGRIVVKMKEASAMFAGMKSSSFCWMSHTWQVAACPPGFRSVARTEKNIFRAEKRRRTAASKSRASGVSGKYLRRTAGSERRTEDKVFPCGGKERHGFSIS